MVNTQHRAAMLFLEEMITLIYVLLEYYAAHGYTHGVVSFFVQRQGIEILFR